MSDNQTEVSVSKDGIRIAGQKVETIAIGATLILVVLVGYVLWEHKAQASVTQQALQTTLEKAFDKISESNTEVARAQREMNCLIAYRRDNNQTPESLLEFCKRITR